MSRSLSFLAVTASLFFVYSCGKDDSRSSDADDGSTTDTGGGPGSGGSQPLAPGEPVPIPGTFEAESYVRFGELDGRQDGVQSCVSEVNFSVDVGASDAASGGCYIGWTASGEWLEYDVVVAESGAFDFLLAVTTVASETAVSLVVDEITRGTVYPTASDGATFQELTIPGVGLSEGEHSVRVAFDTGSVDLDYVRVQDGGACVPACDNKACGDDLCGGTCGTCDDEQICSSSSQCVAPYVLPVQEYGQLAVVDGQLVDEDGDPVVLRGVSTQWLNWDETYSGNADNMEFMRDDWGLEVYRIANGVEGYNGYADPDVREQRYERIADIIEKAIDLDLYVLVDWHTHEIEHKEIAEEFFAQIASDYGDYPNIIYEPFNEPIGAGGNEEFWENELKPYHEDLVEVIRTHDPDNVIVLGTPLWDQRVDIAADDPVEGDNLMYALHFYTCTHTGWLRTRAQAALDAGIGLFVTEWGSTHSDGGTSANPGVCLDEARRWHEFLDENMISSTAWKLTDDPDSSAILTGAPPGGPWTEQHLTEHGRFVREVVQR